MERISKEMIGEYDDERRRTLRFQSFDSGEYIGNADMSYHHRPVPHYYIFDLEVEPEKQGHGYGSRLLTEVENMLKERDRIGVLSDGISEDHIAKGMYERHGWVPLGQTGYLVFNATEEAIERLSKLY